MSKSSLVNSQSHVILPGNSKIPFFNRKVAIFHRITVNFLYFVSHLFMMVVHLLSCGIYHQDRHLNV